MKRVIILFSLLWIVLNLALIPNFKLGQPFKSEIKNVDKPWKDVTDYVKTCLSHFDIFGQLPIWTLAGGETFQTIGLHSLPFIADCYAKGIRGYDAAKALDAMVTSANKDTCGFSMRYFVGLKNYKIYGYVPADLGWRPLHARLSTPAMTGVSHKWQN